MNPYDKDGYCRYCGIAQYKPHKENCARTNQASNVAGSDNATSFDPEGANTAASTAQKIA